MENLEKIMKKEQGYLNYALNVLNKEIDLQQQELTLLPTTHRGDPRLLQVLMSIGATRLRHLHRLGDKPYFARIDFQSAGEKKERYYIGKTDVTDDVTKNVVIDWRAPVASLYYDSNLGESTYLAPEGEITGELWLKRQFTMENKKLLEFFDVDSMSNDELLKPYLGANADNRLKNIVASIGVEQNQIIRWFADRNLVVQGVAGSGKTTVALHRAAYLLYQQRDRWSPKQLMVIGPNRYFIRYIATLLPDIEAEDIGQEVFEEITAGFCKEKLKTVGSAVVLDGIFDGSVDVGIQQYKASLHYQKALYQFYQDLAKESSSFPLMFGELEILSGEKMAAFFAAQDEELYLKQRVKNTITAISAYLKEEGGSLTRRIRLKAEAKILKLPLGDQRMALLQQVQKVEKEIQNGCANLLKQYFKDLNLTATGLLKLFAQTGKDYLPETIDKEGFSTHLLSNLNKKQLHFEDAPALLYSKLLINGAEEYGEYRHVFIDEAQDLGLFHFYGLRKLFPNATFTIVGDLAQGIYSYRSIESWETLKEEIFGGVAAYKELTKSYRTTMEIMSAANLPLKALGATPAVPIIRSGDKPRIIVEKEKSFPPRIVESVENYRQQGLTTFAIITKNKKQASKLHKALTTLGLDCGLIDENTLEPKSVSVLTGYQSKGLEFDMVFVPYCDKENYNPTSQMDMRLLFVSMSRSLHQLELLLTPEKELPLEDFTTEYFNLI